jgi:hypothetical protein
MERIGANLILATIAALTFLAQRTSMDGIQTVSGYADAWRVASMAISGMVIGLLWLIMFRFTKLKIDTRDQLTRPMFGIVIGYMLAAIYIMTDLGSRWGRDLLSWRAPVSLFAGMVMIGSLKTLSGRLRRVVKNAQSNSIVKMTMVDTAQPGPDIDLLDDGKN